MAARRLNGQAVREFRIAYGIGLRELAEAIGKSPGHVTRIEQGHRTTTPAGMRKIADRLGVPLDAITYVIDTEGDEAAA